MQIIIGGDTCITSDFLSKKIIDNQIIDLFKASDFNMLNLECPVTDTLPKEVRIKTGPRLKTRNGIFSVLKKLRIDAVSLANNHILDYGGVGLAETIRNCLDFGIDYVGAGANAIEASKPLIVVRNGVTVAFVNFCENEWSIAMPRSGGANSMDVVDNYNQIREVKQQADYVIVVIHGGHEHYPLPSPRMVKQYRFYAEVGADAVIGHHTHCFSGYEVYGNTPIVYGLGNFIFTLNSPMEGWYWGAIAQLNLEKGRPVQLSIIPVEQVRGSFFLRRPSGENVSNFYGKLDTLSAIIRDDAELVRHWEIYVEKNKKYINAISPLAYIKNRYVRAILTRFGLNKILLTPQYLASLFNRMRCESHRELFLGLLGQKIEYYENCNSPKRG